MKKFIIVLLTLLLVVGAFISLNSKTSRCHAVNCNRICITRSWEIYSHYYCAKHECHFEGCRSLITNDNVKYCEYHTCSIENCNNKCMLMKYPSYPTIKNKSNYCKTHAYLVCIVQACPNDRIEESEYCAEHKCTLSGCSEVRAFNPYSKVKVKSAEATYLEYCKEHKEVYCARVGCHNLIKGTVYCSKHDYEVNHPKKVSPTPTPYPKKYKFKANPSDSYGAGNYASAEDFYDDRYDDFTDFDEAEEYWNDHK